MSLRKHLNQHHFTRKEAEAHEVQLLAQVKG